MTAGVRGVAARVARFKRELGQRDLEILDSLHRVRLLSTDHIQRLHVADCTGSTRPRRARLLLRRLSDRGLITRLSREVGGTRAGSRSAVFCLSALGQAIVEEPESRRRHRVWQVKPYFQDHMLAVSEVFVRLTEACRDGAGELLVFHAEPTCWRQFSGPNGAPVILKPDAYVKVGLGAYELTSFVEVDLGTESLPTIRRKCEIYLRYWQSGREQQQRGVFPQVVWLVPDERRLEGTAGVLRRLAGDMPTGLFTVVLTEHGPTRLTTLPSTGSNTEAAA